MLTSHRVGRTCRYEYTPYLERDRVRNTAKPPAPLGTFDIDQLTPPHIEEIIARRVLDIIGNYTIAQESFIKYFNTVHSWFPVISQKRLQERLPGIWKKPCADFCLLSLCISLITMHPDGPELPNRMRSIYTMIKSSVGALDAIGTNSLELFQCRLLITLFELVHGLYPAAYVSIGAVSRAGVALGVHEKSYQMKHGDQEEAEEARCVWRGIVVIDRLVDIVFLSSPRYHTSEECINVWISAAV